MEHHQIDVDPNPRLIHSLTNENIEFLHPLMQTKILCAVPKNREQIRDRFRFNDSLTFQFQVLFLFYSIILSFFGGLYERLYGTSRETDRTYLLLASAGIVFNASLVDFKKLRVIAATIMLAQIGFNAFFQATFFETVSIPYNHDINTLDHLLKTNLRFVTSQPIYDSLRDITSDSRIQHIKKRLDVNALSQDQLIEVFSEKTHGLLMIECKAHFLAQTIHNDQGNDLVHVVPEPVHEFYQAIVVRKDLPFKRRFDVLIGQMVETGIVQHEFSRVTTYIKQLRLARIKQGQVAPNSMPVADVISCKELIRTVTSHRVFLFASFVAFFGELLCHNFGAYLKRATTEIWNAVRCLGYEMVWKMIVGFKVICTKGRHV